MLCSAHSGALLPRQIRSTSSSRKSTCNGCDTGDLFARSQQPDVKSRLLELTQDAVDRGAFGSPTFFVGKEMFFGKDQLRDVEEAIVEAGASAAKERQQARA